MNTASPLSPEDPPTMWTTLAPAIGFISHIITYSAVLPAGPPDDPRNIHTLHWAGEYIEDDDDPKWGWPEWMVLLTQVDGDPNSLTKLIEAMDEDFEFFIEWGVQPMPLLTGVESKEPHG
jgi:hypothetical protein